MSIHGHRRLHSGGTRELQIALVLTVAMMAVEFLAGWMSRSLSLLADAGHMLTDASALALSLFAVWVSTKPANAEKTFGYYRTEILAALANGVALWGIVVWICVRAIRRVWHPVGVDSHLMIAVALVGLIVNLISGVLLAKHQTSSLNIRSAWLNVMSDALGSLGVIIAGVCIRSVGWAIADPLASIVIALLIAVNSWQLVVQSVNVLLEGAPAHVKTEEVVHAMRQLSGVVDVHDVHLWTITTGLDAMSGHVLVEDVRHSDQLLAALSATLSQQFGITHTTFQLESSPSTDQPAHQSTA